MLTLSDQRGEVLTLTDPRTVAKKGRGGGYDLGVFCPSGPWSVTVNNLTKVVKRQRPDPTGSRIIIK